MRTFSATFAGETDYVFVGALDATGKRKPASTVVWGNVSRRSISDGLHAGVAKDHLSEELSEGSVCPGGFKVTHSIFNPAKRRQAFCGVLRTEGTDAVKGRAADVLLCPPNFSSKPRRLRTHDPPPIALEWGVYPIARRRDLVENVAS
jgi:hypothetical protein